MILVGLRYGKNYKIMVNISIYLWTNKATPFFILSFPPSPLPQTFYENQPLTYNRLTV
jgi:hypothetical protein